MLVPLPAEAERPTGVSFLLLLLFPPLRPRFDELGERLLDEEEAGEETWESMPPSTIIAGAAEMPEAMVVSLCVLWLRWLLDVVSVDRRRLLSSEDIVRPRRAIPTAEIRLITC